MKYYCDYFKNLILLPFICWFLTFIFPNNLLGQSIWKLNILPFGMTIGNSNVQEAGIGEYEFKIKRSINYQIGFSLNKYISPSFALDFGLYLSKLNLNFNYRVTDPLNGIEEFANENRFMRKFIFSPHVGILFSRQKFIFKIGIAPNLDINYNTNVVDGQSPLYIFFDPVSQKSGQLTIAENDSYLNNLKLYLTPDFGVSYSINSNISIEAQLKFKPFGNWRIYNLFIEGRTAEMPEGLYTLNDIRILNRFSIAYIGISYALHK